MIAFGMCGMVGFAFAGLGDESSPRGAHGGANHARTHNRARLGLSCVGWFGLWLRLDFRLQALAEARLPAVGFGRGFSVLVGLFRWLRLRLYAMG